MVCRGWGGGEQWWAILEQLPVQLKCQKPITGVCATRDGKLHMHNLNSEMSSTLNVKLISFLSGIFISGFVFYDFVISTIYSIFCINAFLNASFTVRISLHDQLEKKLFATLFLPSCMKACTTCPAAQMLIRKLRIFCFIPRVSVCRLRSWNSTLKIFT